MSPVDGSISPDKIFRNVDLPAPFAPIKTVAVTWREFYVNIFKQFAIRETQTNVTYCNHLCPPTNTAYFSVFSPIVLKIAYYDSIIVDYSYYIVEAG